MKQIDPIVHTFPAPAVLIGCGSVEKPNLITCSWFGTVNSEPPMVGVSIRKTRFSYDLVTSAGEFTVNIPFKRHLDLVKYCGANSGKDVDKFDARGLEAQHCPPLKQAPMIKDFPLVLACKVVREHQLGSHNLFVGEILKIYCDDELVRPSGRPDPSPENQIVYLDGKYWELKPME